VADATRRAPDGGAPGAERGAGLGDAEDSGRLVAVKVLSSRRQGMDEWLVGARIPLAARVVTPCLLSAALRGLSRLAHP